MKERVVEFLILPTLESKIQGIKRHKYIIMKIA